MKHNTNLTLPTVTVAGFGIEQDRRVELDRRAIEHVITQLDDIIFRSKDGPASSPVSKVDIYLAEHLRDLLEAMPGDGLDVLSRCQRCGEFSNRQHLRYSDAGDLLCVFCSYAEDSDVVEEVL